MNLAERVRRGKQAISIARQRGIDTSDWERHLHELESQTDHSPVEVAGFEPWVLREWRRLSIPDWRRILEKSITANDTAREAYARWMLRDILYDPSYQEPAE
mgnify:CR=1 FL=1|jgi:hypothetical protein